MRTPRRLSMLSAVVCATALAFAAPAMADAPKFHSASSSIDDAGALVVDFDVRGLGNENIDYTLTADATATYACINGGGKHPQAANKKTINAEVSAAASFEPKNGRVVASMTADAPSSGDFGCPSGQTLVLAAVAYTNVVLTDTTNDASTGVADASATLVDVR